MQNLESGNNIIRKSSPGKVHRLLAMSEKSHPSSFRVADIEEHLKTKKEYEEIEFLCIEMAEYIESLERMIHNQGILLRKSALN